MALAFPRAMLCGVLSSQFEIRRFMSTNQLAGGTTQVREAAEPRWMAEFTYAPMGRAAFQQLQAWLDTLRGGLRFFLAHDALKPYPVGYGKAALLALTRAGGGAFDGTATLSSISATGFTLTSLPGGFALKAGDHIGLVQSGRFGLFRIVEDATASGGGAVTLTVEPRVPTNLFTTGALAHLVRPSCTMILDPASISASRSAGSRAPITFSGIQALG
ncbi:hypothetical protein [uncultured Enterovirga sp.]|uniref:hypothetical protein n=1 Tax=uncultured Enterovirga sp. TaxID=2026352 RepID=UPI0035CB2406